MHTCSHWCPLCGMSACSPSSVHIHCSHGNTPPLLQGMTYRHLRLPLPPLLPSVYTITKFELACLSGRMYIVYAFPCWPYLAYITLVLNRASWTVLVAQLAEHWTSNPVVMDSIPSEAAQCFHCLPSDSALPHLTLPCLPLHTCICTCTRFDRFCSK